MASSEVGYRPGGLNPFATLKRIEGSGRAADGIERSTRAASAGGGVSGGDGGAMGSADQPHVGRDINPEVQAVINTMSRGTRDLREFFNTPEFRFTRGCATALTVLACLTAVAAAAITIYLGITDSLPSWGQPFLIATGSVALFSAMSSIMWIASKGATASFVAAQLDDRIQTIAAEIRRPETVRAAQTIATRIVEDVARLGIEQRVEGIARNVVTTVAEQLARPELGAGIERAAHVVRTQVGAAQTGLATMARGVDTALKDPATITRLQTGATQAVGEVATRVRAVATGIATGIQEAAQAARQPGAMDVENLVHRSVDGLRTIATQLVEAGGRAATAAGQAASQAAGHAGRAASFVAPSSAAPPSSSSSHYSHYPSSMSDA